MRFSAMSSAPTTIVVVGGGLAALILVQQLREQLMENVRPIQILVIDPAPSAQFGRGRAYAEPWQPEQTQRLGSCAELLNSSASRMSMVELMGIWGDFVSWLRCHKPIWSQRLGLVFHDGKLQPAKVKNCQLWEQRAIAQWLNFNRHALDAEHYETVYFPRCVYGDFLAELAVNVLRSSANGNLHVRYVQAEAQRLHTGGDTTDGHTLSLAKVDGNACTLHCDYLVYAGGDLPPQVLGESLEPHPMLLQNLYDQPRHRFHQNLVKALSDGRSQPLQLVVAGGNACALDCLWGLANNPVLLAAMQCGKLQIKQLAATNILHSGAVLQPLPEGETPDELRWASPAQQQLLQQLREEFLDPEQNLTAESYYLAVCTALEQLEAHASPHLFMLFLRQLGEVEQQIRDSLPDIVCFAIDYHVRLEGKLLFTPYEYWQSVRQLREMPQALVHLSDKVTELRREQNRFVLQLSGGDVLYCDAVVNCTGARNPFATHGTTLLDQWVASGLGVTNGTGGFYLANDGRLKLADGTFSNSIYLVTQRSMGLHYRDTSATPRFISANRLTAVRVAELARDIGAALTVELQAHNK